MNHREPGCGWVVANWLVFERRYNCYIKDYLAPALDGHVFTYTLHASRKSSSFGFKLLGEIHWQLLALLIHPGEVDVGRKCATENLLELNG